MVLLSEHTKHTKRSTFEAQMDVLHSEGWKLENQTDAQDAQSSGLVAMHFTNPRHSDIHFVIFAGTHNLGGALDDLKLFFSFRTYQEVRAYAWLEKIGLIERIGNKSYTQTRKILFVGHSLGGYLAQVMSGKSLGSFVGFNAAADKRIASLLGVPPRGVNFVTRADPVVGLLRPFQRGITYKVKGTGLTHHITNKKNFTDDTMATLYAKLREGDVTICLNKYGEFINVLAPEGLLCLSKMGNVNKIF
jgi:hypothetical protein